MRRFDSPRSSMRLHRGGRFRAWLGARLGGDAALGDRIWRRILHALGAGVLLYYLLPPNVLVVAPNWVIPLLALAAFGALEVLRLNGWVEVPAIRSYEEHRPASYAYFALAIVAAILLFPEAIAAAVVLGTAMVDPIAGELRRTPSGRRWYPYVPFVVYLGLAGVAFVAIGHWPLAPSLGLAALAAALAVAAEMPKWKYVDDDLAMTLVPGVVLDLIVYLVPALV